MASELIGPSTCRCSANEAHHARPHAHARYAGEVEVVGDHRLRLRFDDGNVGEVDFAEREKRGELEPLRDAAYFAQVRVDAEAYTIAWPTGIDLSPEPLYEEANILQPA